MFFRLCPSVSCFPVVVNKTEPVAISQLHRVKVIKILGVTITNGLSVSPHVQSVIASCAQVSHALRVLRAHGLCDSALHTIYRSVVIAKLLCIVCLGGFCQRYRSEQNSIVHQQHTPFNGPFSGTTQVGRYQKG